MDIANIMLGVGIPNNWTHVPSVFFDSYAMLSKPPQYIYLRSAAGNISAMRNILVHNALMSGCSHLIMMDADMLYHPQTLIKLLSRQLDVVGALCWRRYPPFDPLLYKGKLGYYEELQWPDVKDQELVEVDATGTGCLMFNTEVFKNISPPWFVDDAPNPNEDDGGVVGEDIGFCSKLRNAGYQIFVDLTVPTEHLSTFRVNEKSHLLYRKIKELQTIRLAAKDTKV